MRPAGVLAVADGLSSGAAGVELTRSRLPVLRAAVRCPLCGGNDWSCDTCPAGQAGPIARTQGCRPFERAHQNLHSYQLVRPRRCRSRASHTVHFDATRPFPLSAARRTAICCQKRKHHSHVAADTPPVRAAVSESFRPALAAFAHYRPSQPPEIHVTRLHCATWCRFIVRNPGTRRSQDATGGCALRRIHGRT